MDKSSRVMEGIYRIFVGFLMILFGKMGWAVSSESQALVLTGIGAGVVMVAMCDLVHELQDWLKMGRDSRCKTR